MEEPKEEPRLCRQCGRPYEHPVRHDLCSDECLVAFETGLPILAIGSSTLLTPPMIRTLTRANTNIGDVIVLNTAGTKDTTTSDPALAALHDIPLLAPQNRKERLATKSLRRKRRP